MKSDIADLAEELRSAVSAFVRTVRHETGTPRTAKSDTLELLEREGALNVAMLAQFRNVKHQSMRLVTAQLEAEGLIQRGAATTDLRSQPLAITQAGRDWLANARLERAAHISEMIQSRLSAREYADLRRAARLLQRLAGADRPD